MDPVYDRLGVRVFEGDCLHIMRTLPDESVDSVVTDPPAGIQFMGKSWDSNRGGRDRWIEWLIERMAEALRVLKPGGHALVWALPRTSHWTALALEDAGFEIRDCITHLFGTGFPKSLNVSKAIDKAAGAQRAIVGYRPQFPDGTRGATYAGQGTIGATNGFTSRSETVNGMVPVTAPATAEASLWEGWGTALKPASEHWWLVRKPFRGTVASNVLGHGTGALNIDGCRINMSDVDRVVVDHRSGASSVRCDEWGTRGEYAAGRWPPNTVLSHAALLDSVTGEPIGDACADGCVDGCPVAELDRQSVGVERNGATYTDSGGASRFFPCFRWEAKAPTGERPRVNGSVHPTVKSVALMRWLVRLVTPPGGTVLDCFAGTGPTGQAARAEGFRSILVESDPLSIPFIRARLDAHPKTEAAAAGFPVVEPEQDLFDLLNNA